jgi:hypothetical protein
MTQERLIKSIERAIILEKLKLMEAKQAKDFADTDIDYRERRIASLKNSLKEEQNEKASLNTTISTTATK